MVDIGDQSSGNLGGSIQVLQSQEELVNLDRQKDGLQEAHHWCMVNF